MEVEEGRWREGITVGETMTLPACNGTVRGQMEVLCCVGWAGYASTVWAAPLFQTV